MVSIPRHELSTAGVGVKVTPTVLTSFVRYVLRRRRDKRAGKPTAELSYAEGLKIVRTFLEYAATHPVSELQAFTGHKVPTPNWVVKEVVHIPDEPINRAAQLIRKHLQKDGGLEKVGGDSWWTMRGRDLMCEWIEMKKQKIRRGANAPDRVLLYIHGGAHFFSSLETHRYQIQRHARKLNARAFAPAYRLSPQYPFPCALQDVLASYLYLIDQGFQAHQILFSGDSSGAGLALALMVLLRDLGLPLPAGATLISPWVDLAHSFPSISENDSGDYIPSIGFHYRPGIVWPPLKDVGQTIVLEGDEEEVVLDEQMQMYASNLLLNHPMVSPVNQGSLGGLPPLYICAGSAELLRDEIIYIAHKAASPSQYPPSPDILTRYPTQQKHLDADYPPTLVQLQVFDEACHVATTLSVTSLAKFMYRGTANFGIWALTAAKKRHDREKAEQNGHKHRHHHGHASADSSHRTTPSSSGPPTRSSTLSPFSSADQSTSALTQVTSANSGSSSSSSLSQAVHAAISSGDVEAANLAEHDLSSESEAGSDDEDSCSSEETDDGEDVGNGATSASPPIVRVTGHIPTFHDSMIRQRVSTTGRIRPLEPAETLPATTMKPENVGKLHKGPVRKWLAERERYDHKYAKEHEKYRQLRLADRAAAEANGFLQGKFVGQNPPMASLAGWHDEKLALRCGESVDEIGTKTNMALEYWARISQNPDEQVSGDTKIKELREKMQQSQVGEEGEQMRK